MKTLLCCSAALILMAVPATAQNNEPTIQPNELTRAAKQKPPLQLSDEQRRKIQDALVTAHSAQKAPDNFEAKVGAKVPTKLKLDAMPAPLINEEPVLMQYDFVKLENLNGHYLRAMPDSEIVSQLKALIPHLPDGAALAARIDDDAWWKIGRAMPGLKERAKTLIELLKSASHAVVHSSRPVARS